jgi:Na+/melibiose symporter-like transporter
LHSIAKNVSFGAAEIAQGAGTNMVGSIPPVPASRAPPLTVGFKISYAMGATAEAITFQGASLFLLIYYNQVLGVSPGLVGLALSAGLMVNAVFEPVVGSWSDRVRTRLGRRHPFMFAAAAPIALCFYALYSPPAGLSSTGLLIWLTVFYILLQQTASAYEAPHLALGGELSDDYIERSSVMAYNTFFAWVGDAVTALVALKLFFKATEGFPNGALNPANYPAFAFWTAATLLVLRFYSAFATVPRIPYLAQTALDTPKFSVIEFWRDILRALKNRNYVMMLFGLLFFALMTGVRNGLYLYTMTYFWQLTNDEIAWFFVGSLSGYVFAAFVVKRLHVRFDKNWTAGSACFMYTVGPAIPYVLAYFGVISAETPYLLVILIGFSLFQHTGYSLLTTSTRSALADIADENELKTGLRQEGILFAARTFFQRVDTALGTMLAGWTLVLINFPAKAVPGQVEQTALDGIGLAFLLTVIPGTIAAIFYCMLRVTRKSYDTTRAALEVARANRAVGLAPASKPA